MTKRIRRRPLRVTTIRLSVKDHRALRQLALPLESRSATIRRLILNAVQRTTGVQP